MPSSLSAYSPLQLLVLTLQCLCGVAGLVLLWRDRGELKARLSGKAPARLSPPPYPLYWLFVGAVFAIGGAVLFNIGAMTLVARWLSPAPSGEIGLFEVLVGGATQLGVVAGIAHVWFYHLRAHRPPADAPRPLGKMRAIGAGALTFLAVLPVVWVASLGWHLFLKTVGVPPTPQPLVSFFGKTSDPLTIVAVFSFAVVGAPIAEELVFRAGFLRALRGHVARPLALIFPALVFTWLHDSFTMLAPLLALAIGFSLAYERSGHPLTPITAHALFNLNTLALLLVGFPA